MTTLIILLSLFVLILIVALLCLYLVKDNRDKKKRAKKETKKQLRKIKEGQKDNKDKGKITRTLDDSQLNRKVWFLIILTIVLVIFSFYSPFIFTRKAINEDFDFSSTGAIGDTIGGLMNPFIALAGVIVTGLAFYIQYKANLQQRVLFQKELDSNYEQVQEQIKNQDKQQKLQFFESQFYEMLKLHRDNVSEMQIEGYHFEETTNGVKYYEKSTNGRKIFVVMANEFHSILDIYTKLLNRPLDSNAFENCYKLFFFGLDDFISNNNKDDDFINELDAAKKQHLNIDRSITDNNIRKKYKKEVRLYFNYKPYSGHSSRLSHYFRHLYLTVKLVVESKEAMDYEEKIKYLKILRAQLSEFELVFLFYNYVGGFGKNWELFFNEYGMIHNLDYRKLYRVGVIEDNINYFKTKPGTLRKGKMFDIDK